MRNKEGNKRRTLQLGVTVFIEVVVVKVVVMDVMVLKSKIILIDCSFLWTRFEGMMKFTSCFI
ncbi:MAG: hypothetical protein ACFFAU_01720 [Candidatus Hodarchaeota archaeon]